MSSFVGGFDRHVVLTHGLLRAISSIRESRGQEQLWIRQAPEVLNALREAALIQSTESSNRIEKVIAPPERIRALVRGSTEPQTRSEQEIAGYREVLSTIHGSHADIPFTPRVVQQLHRDLFRFTPSPGGAWKSNDNRITETLPNGEERVRFEATPAFQTPEAMDRLHNRFLKEWDADQFEKLLLIPAYVLDFLCIHPFRDGNGRMARLLTLLLLYKAGFEVGKYISLERIVESTKESYYETLHISSQNWHQAEQDMTSWVEYFLGVLQAAYRDFESRVGHVRSRRGAKTDQVLEAVRRLPEAFGISELVESCPNVSKEMIRHILKQEKADGRLDTEGSGRGARWRKQVTEVD